MSKYTYNVNKYCIEKDERFFAYVNTIGANRIVKLLNEQEELIKRLKQIREKQIETILKQKRKIKELEDMVCGTTLFEDIEFKCILDKEKSCNDCDECILCYKCVFLQKRRDNLKVKCDLKGEVDIHSTCDLYRKNSDVDD